MVKSDRPRQVGYLADGAPAPIAQWIERCPPEAKTRVRVAVGVPKCACPEQHTPGTEEFFAMLRFEGRNKLAELPAELVKVGRDNFFNRRKFFFPKSTNTR